MSYKYLLVDEDISKENLQKLVVDNRPSDAENEGLEIDSWTTYIPDEMYNFTVGIYRKKTYR